MNKKNSLYFASKPIQYFNITNIEDSNNKDLLLISYFKDAESLAKRAQASGYWNSVQIFEDYKSAFSSIEIDKFDKVFIDSDYGLSKFLFLRKFKNSIISVYEEGIGTYSNHLRSSINLNFKKTSLFSQIISLLITKVYSIMGNYDYHGGSKYTNQIIVYNPEEYLKGKDLKNKIIKKFNLSFQDHLKCLHPSNVLYPTPLNFNDIKGKKIVLYLSQWELDPQIEIFLKRNYPEFHKILKPHPHNSGEQLGAILKNTCFDEVIPGEIMIEFLINDLIECSEELLIVHHGTSALSNFDPHSFKQIIL